MTHSLEKEFEQIFRKHYGKLCRLAQGYLQENDASEDVVQELFVKLWQEQPQLFVNENDAIPYLQRAVRNNCISVLRKKFQTVSMDDEEGSFNMDWIPQEEESDQAVRESLHEQVSRAIEMLPPKCAIVFKLHRFSDLSYKEIAEQLGISVKTVENQMGKALRILRENVHYEKSL
jgi:RNA polymerase sigma-70 factor (family 1)